MPNELETFLSGIYVVDGKGFDFEKSWQPLVDYSQHLGEKYGRWLSVSDARSLLYRIIDDWTVRDLGSGNLCHLLGTEACAEMRAAIESQLSGLPNEYRFYFRLANAKDIGTEELALSKVVRLTSIQEPKKYLRHYVRPGLASLFEEFVTPRPSKAFEAGETYLEITGRGFFVDADSTAAVSAVSVLKQWVGLSVACGALKFDWSYVPEQHKEYCCALQKPSETPHWFVLTPTWGRYLAQLNLDEDMFVWRGLLATQADGTPTPRQPEQIQEAIRKRFEKIGFVVDQRPNDPDTQSLRTAAEWFFDSSSEPNQTLSFIYCAIGLEAVLQGTAEGNKADTSERLADRTAYLLGRTRTERSKIRDAFGQFYGVRKNIVHGRANRLERDQARWLYWGRQILADVVARELHNVRTDQAASKDKSV